MQNEQHHPFAPSVLERRRDCPASYRIEKDLPDIENEASRKGTRLHELIAAAITADGKVRTKTEDETFIVKRTLAYLNKTLKTGLLLRPEERLEYVDENGEVLFYGTCDLVAIDENDQLMVFDWKTGSGEVTLAKYNLQLKAYALAAMQKYKKTSCKAFIYSTKYDGDSKWTFKNSKALRDEIVGIIDACKNENALPSPSYSHCRFCRGSLHGTCTARIDQSKYKRAARRQEAFSQAEKEIAELEKKKDAPPSYTFTELKPKRKTSGCAWVLLIIIILFVIMAFVSNTGTGN